MAVTTSSSYRAGHDTIPTHVTRVVATERLGPAYVRVTFGGGLERFGSAGPDDFVYVLLPPPGRRELTIDTTFGWEQYATMPESERPVGAYYTVRHHRPDADELDCDVHLHDPAGIVSSWALHARPGDPVALWGPRTAWTPPSTTTEWLLVADETGIPAVAAILEQRPPELPAQVYVETTAGVTLPPLPAGEHVTVHRLDRGADPPGTSPVLVEAVRAAGRPAATTYAWGGAESRSMTAIRRYLRHDVGLARTQVSMTPYWRHAAHLEEPSDDDA